MKLGLISDVHGDFVALELAWSHLTVLGADRIVCAGDLVGYGPSPDRVVAFLAEHQVASARGNHDRWALSRAPETADEFGGGTPGPEAREFLQRLPFDLVIADGSRLAVVVHGSPTSDMEFVTPRTHSAEVLRGYLTTLNTDLLVIGHTHRPMWYRSEHGLVVNPGSVISMPVVRTSRTCALVDLADLTVSFHDVENGEVIHVDPWPDAAVANRSEAAH